MKRKNQREKIRKVVNTAKKELSKKPKYRIRPLLLRTKSTWNRTMLVPASNRTHRILTIVNTLRKICMDLALRIPSGLLTNTSRRVWRNKMLKIMLNCRKWFDHSLKSRKHCEKITLLWKILWRSSRNSSWKNMLMSNRTKRKIKQTRNPKIL